MFVAPFKHSDSFVPKGYYTEGYKSFSLFCRLSADGIWVPRCITALDTRSNGELPIVHQDDFDFRRAGVLLSEVPVQKPLSYTRTVESALIELQRAATPEEVWKASVKLMRAAMPLYNVLFGLSSLGITPMFMRATLPIPNVERFAQLAPLNHVVREHPMTPVARMSDYFSPESPDGRAFEDEFLKPMGWRYASAMLFWNPDGRYLGLLSPIRTEEQGDFTAGEMYLLRELHPHMDAAVRRLFALEEKFAAHLSLEHAIGSLPLPIVVASWNCELDFSNAAAREAMSAWQNGNTASGRALKPASVLPPEMLAACPS